MRNKWLSWAWSLALGLCLVMPLRAAAQETSTPESERDGSKSHTSWRAILWTRV